MVQNVITEIRPLQGFDAYVLQNGCIELAIVPELGAKIVSLRNLRTGRQWMWRPDDARGLFTNQLGDDFATSTLAGWDECLPTIAPCQWKGRNLPDHGETWSRPWQVDGQAWQEGRIATTLELPISPFSFARSLALVDQEVRIDYTLINRSAEPEAFLWAMHPLFAIQPGDHVEVGQEVRDQLGSPAWLDTLEIDPSRGGSKVFARPQDEGRAAVVNSQTGDRLTFLWSLRENDTLGLWLTRGGWNGHHHLAIEPTNGMPDALCEAAALHRCGLINPYGRRAWSVRLRVENG